MTQIQNLYAQLEGATAFEDVEQIQAAINQLHLTAMKEGRAPEDASPVPERWQMVRQSPFGQS